MMMWLFKVGKKGAPNPAPATEVTEAVSHLGKGGSKMRRKPPKSATEELVKAGLCCKGITQAKFSNVGYMLCSKPFNSGPLRATSPSCPMKD